MKDNSHNNFNPDPSPSSASWDIRKEYGEAADLSVLYSGTMKDEHNKSEKSDLLFEVANDSVFLHDEKGNIIKVNQRACDFLGYSRDELTQMNIADIYPPVNIPDLKDKIERVLSDERMIFEINHILRNGTEIPVEVISRIFEYDNQKLILSTARDISGRKESEKRLVEAKQQAEDRESEMTALFNKVPSVIFLFDEDSRILKINEKGTSLFGVDENSTKNKRIGDIFKCVNTNHASHTCGTGKHCSTCLLSEIINKTVSQNQEFDRIETPLTAMDGNTLVEKTVLVSTALLKKNGHRTFLATLEDITSRKKMETDLVIAKEKAEESEKLKTAFLNNISHEIRTPLNGILGFATIIEDESYALSPEDRKKIFEMMKISGKRLTDTVSDLVDISKIDSGVSELAKETFDLQAELEAFIETEQLNFTNQAFRFSYENSLGIKDKLIWTDKSKLLRIVRNLLNNACKFTKQGHVRLSVVKQGTTLKISVEDSGIGIAKKDLTAVFAPFFQADSKLTRGYEGIGLGLTIADKLARYMGGDITVESELGIGSVFSINIPNAFPLIDISDMQETEQVSVQLQSLKGKTILIAEDDYTNYLYLEAVLSNFGCKLLHAWNGIEAIEMCVKHESIDLLLLDLKMPMMDGFQAAIEIRKTKSDLPIIAQSAYTHNNEEKRALDAGCNEYLTKPLSPQKLSETIFRYIH